MISVDDYPHFVDDAVEALVGIVVGLGDDLANRRPQLSDTNSPYAIVIHCLGVMEYWAGELVAGRTVQRDRAAEFNATGAVAGLVEKARLAKRQLRTDLSELDAFAPPRGTPRPGDRDLPKGQTQGGALLHLYEELAQHLGQLELTRDMLMAS